MRNLTPASITQAFADYAKNAPSERTRTLLVGLAGHLHSFVRENKVTQAEWGAAIDALTRATQFTDDKRNEYILFSDLLGDVRGLSVLDLACGHGHYMSSLRRLGARHVTGVDISPEMVRLARQTLSDDKDGVDFRVGDAADLPVLGSFDVVTAVWLFNYAESAATLRDMMAGAARNLAEGGRLVAVTVHPSFDPMRGDWVKYGLRVHESAAAPGRDQLTAALIAPEGDMPIDISRWDAEVYEDAVSAAGLRCPRWTMPVVPDRAVAQRGADFWADYTTNPFVVGFTARR